MIISKYSGESHSPRKESIRRTAVLSLLVWPLAACGGTMMSEGLYIESVGSCARPELIPTEVWTQRRKGEVCMMIRKRLRLKPGLFSFLASYSSLACSRMPPM